MLNIADSAITKMKPTLAEIGDDPPPPVGWNTLGCLLFKLQLQPIFERLA